MKVDVRRMVHLENRIRFLENEKKDVEDDEEIKLLDKLIEKRKNELEPIKKQYEEVWNFWSNNLYKYFEVTFKNCGAYETIYMFPYKLIPSNQCLFGVYDFNSEYDKGLRDTSMNLETFYTYDYDLTEITKEEFLQKTNKNSDMPLTSRLNKLRNRDKVIE